MAIKPTSERTEQRYRVHNPIYMARTEHQGFDQATPMNTAVKATKDGKLTWLGDAGDGFGKRSKLVTRFGFVHYFSHLNKPKGGNRKVKQGEVIAYTGNTGLSTGPHLDWMVEWKRGVNLDPELWLWMERKFESYEKTIATQKKQITSQSKKITNYQKAIKEMQSIINGLSTTEEVTAMKTKLTQLQADLDKANNQLADEDRIIDKIINAIKEIFNGSSK